MLMITSKPPLKNIKIDFIISLKAVPKASVPELWNELNIDRMIDKILFNNPQKITTGIQNTQVAIKKNKLIKVPNFLKIPMVILM